jgi:hypothetical protein
MAQSAVTTDEGILPGEPTPARPGRPPLTIVRHEESTSLVETGEPLVREPNVGRSAVTWAIVGFVVATAAITVAGTLSGLGAGGSFALGAFAGIWGGLGFGFMMGGTIPLARYLDTHPDS